MTCLAVYVERQCRSIFKPTTIFELKFQSEQEWGGVSLFLFDPLFFACKSAKVKITCRVGFSLGLLISLCPSLPLSLSPSLCLTHTQQTKSAPSGSCSFRKKALLTQTSNSWTIVFVCLGSLIIWKKKNLRNAVLFNCAGSVGVTIRGNWSFLKRSHFTISGHQPLRPRAWMEVGGPPLVWWPKNSQGLHPGDARNPIPGVGVLIPQYSRIIEQRASMVC